MNAEQLTGQLRTALAFGGPLAAVILSKTGWTQGDYELYLQAFLFFVPPLVAAAWSWWIKRDAAQITDAIATVENKTLGLKLVVTNDRVAPEAAVDASNDPNRPKVENATP